MMKAVFLFLLLLAALPASAQDQPIPRLGDHVFVPVMVITEPFITTHVQTSVSLGQTVNSTVPVIDVTDSTLIGTTKASIMLAGIGFKYQQGVKDWLAVRLSFGTAGRVGTSTSSLVAEGVTAALKYDLGWIIRTYQSSDFVLSTSLSLGNNNATFINLLDWANGIIEGTYIPLVRSRPSLVGTAGVHAGWGLSRRFGVLGSIKMSYGESFEGTSGNQWDPDGRLAVSYDLKYDLGVPLGLGVTGGYYESNQGVYTSGGVGFWSARLALQTRDDFTLGFDFSGYYTESSEFTTSQQVSQFTIDMRYYY
jgi:hypothetical protein